jgi:glycerol uptake facilitator-like aquaporin
MVRANKMSSSIEANQLRILTSPPIQSVTFAPDSAPGGGNANQTVVFIALSYGFSLLIAAWVLYRISGGLFNPAVTLGMVITGTLPPMRGLVLFPAQILGAMSAAGVVSCIIPADIAIVQTTLAPNVNVAQGLFLEMVRPAIYSARELPSTFKKRPSNLTPLTFPTSS